MREAIWDMENPTGHGTRDMGTGTTGNASLHALMAVVAISMVVPIAMFSGCAMHGTSPTWERRDEATARQSDSMRDAGGKVDVTQGDDDVAEGGQAIGERLPSAFPPTSQSSQTLVTERLSESGRMKVPEQSQPSLGAYVAPSPYEGNRAKVGNERELKPVASTSHKMATGTNAVRRTVAWQELSVAIHDVEERGYHVGISLADMNGNVIVSYNQNSPMYPASSIKAPYVVAVWEGTAEHPDSLVRWTEAILEWSDNDSYHAIREVYGADPMIALASASGLDMSYFDGDIGTWSAWYYPLTSAHDLTRLWCHMSTYLLDAQGGDARLLRQAMAEREVSPMRDALPLCVTTYGKAGWLSEYGDYGATPAMVDAGIVIWPDGRSYVASIMTDTKEDAESVATIATCLDRVHYTICYPVE